MGLITDVRRCHFDRTDGWVRNQVRTEVLVKHISAPAPVDGNQCALYFFSPSLALNLYGRAAAAIHFPSFFTNTHATW